MNTSSTGEKSSGFSKSNESGSSTELRTPNFGRSRSVVSRPRFVTVKKSFSSLNNRSFAGTNLNPFAPASENSAPASLESGLGVSGSGQSGFGSNGNESVFGGVESTEKNNCVFGSDENNFVFGSDCSVKSSASMVTNQMMNLNVKNNVNCKEMDSFCFGGSKTSPACLGGGKIDGDLSDEKGSGSSFVEFKSPNLKLHIATMREAVKRRKGRLKHSASLQPRRGNSQETYEAYGSFSPSDMSPHEHWHSRGTSVASDESLSLERTVSSSTLPSQRMNSGEGFDSYSDREIGPDDSISMVDTESFKSAVEEGDYSSDIAVTPADYESSSTTGLERKDSVGRRPLGFPPMADSNFTFATPSTAQAQSTPRRHHQRKKKTGPDAPKSSANAKIPNVPSSSVAKLFPCPEPSLISSHARRSHKGDLSSLQRKSGHSSKADKGYDLKNESSSASTSSTIAAQEACEKWRLRGNQAYANGNLSKAEDYYTEGVNCIPKSETSRSCLRALMLCYSNRAATRMAVGRMRSAIADCVAAATIDPNFLKAQVKAANCYLALGELEDASRYYTVCLQSESDCVDRKMAVEASDGLQKAQRVSECMHHCAELVEKKTPKDAERIVELTADALLISPYSRSLVEMNAEALFMLGRYEEVVQLCEGTFDYVENNDPISNTDSCSDNSEASETLGDSSFRIKLCLMIFNSYFHLGRLAEAVAALEKHDSKRKGDVSLESSTPLAVTVRELLRHKAAGNEAFQAGRHGEAVDHYTAALSCNVNSHTFAAICLCSRAAAYNSMGQITDAIADCSLAIALDGHYAKAFSRRAALFEMIRDYVQAGSDMRRLVALLTKQVEGKSSCSERASELKQAHQRLCDIEERAKKAIPLDMYLILGVEPSVLVADIKKAYRKAALRHHPDKACQALARSDSGDDEIGKAVHKDADKLFKMIGEAYAVLSDATKRSWYDAEEEMRITMKKRNTPTSTPKSYPNNENHTFERSVSARQWRSPTNNVAYRKSETFRSNRF